MYKSHIETVELMRKIVGDYLTSRLRIFGQDDAELKQELIRLVVALKYDVTTWQLLGQNMAKQLWNKYFKDMPDNINFLMNLTLELQQRSFEDDAERSEFLKFFSLNLSYIHDKKSAIPKEAMSMIPDPDVAQETLQANVWLLPIFILQMIDIVPFTERRGRSK